jgi:hypothetical protein
MKQMGKTEGEGAFRPLYPAERCTAFRPGPFFVAMARDEDICFFEEKQFLGCAPDDISFFRTSDTGR